MNRADEMFKDIVKRILEESYPNTAAWLLDEYNELIRQIESGEFVPHEYN